MPGRLPLLGLLLLLPTFGVPDGLWLFPLLFPQDGVPEGLWVLLGLLLPMPGRPVEPLLGRPVLLCEGRELLLLREPLLPRLVPPE